MTHRFPIKEIALQAGMGTATVDRVLNGRAHVSPQTRARVMAAIDELTQQEGQMSARGRRVFFDVVVEAPTRFSREVKRAAEEVLPGVSAAVIRPRFVLGEVMRDDEVLATVTRILKRGSQGVCLKLRDTPLMRAAIAELTAAGIPVVTLFTDIASPARLGYFGLENAAAGQVAAYLMDLSLPKGPGTILATQSNLGFLGEGARADAFAVALRQLRPELKIISATGGSGLPHDTAQDVMRVLRGVDDLVAVYSMGGGNRAIDQVLSNLGHAPHLFIAHDLDRENKDLLLSRCIQYVLHHDLHTDLRNAFHRLLRHHRLMPADTVDAPSNVQIITPANLPRETRRA
ncbi:LacI family DNA-binding transcriptional regulator [Aliiroseovarius lamellibrachiae]|uniref:LacI family DNA-binding transcriptional regulator n=1 Tax=Aliiroseovarius lamellibrachiae TaxID=1924933 RepID=UPI001BDF8F23|nr:LacI family DNA-binding transcriptional regulator [Aliiroseovarius lamellibrachiae]MBT2132383.1 LacI family DNA-binding transcriptional regulator [Aliiroseovarius lamellibrachiae]